MTECERFVKEGLFTPDFFKEEVQCDFLVTTERKKIWAVGIDLLLQLDKVCRKHGLRYFLAYGSLLGAVRHRGFIPWDDDMDVVMLRADYEKLLLLANEFKEPYFLQTPVSDSNAFFSYAKLRNSRTSMIHSNFKHRKMNMGMLLDIFPLDSYVAERGQERFDLIKRLIMCNSTYMRLGNPNLKAQDVERVRAYDYKRNPIDVYWEIQRVARQFESVYSDYVSCAVMTVYPLARSIFPVELFGGEDTLPFCGFEFPVPRMPECFLKIVYGEHYMQFPPVEQRGTWHSDVVMDPDRPYTEYLKEVKSV